MGFRIRLVPIMATLNDLDRRNFTDVISQNLVALRVSASKWLTHYMRLRNLAQRIYNVLKNQNVVFLWYLLQNSGDSDEIC